MRLTQLRYLVAIYEEKSFTAAARRVHATQSGLSMQIKDLEERLNVKLFNRSSTGVTPTAVGEKLYRRATHILREVSAIQNDVEAMSGQVSGTVHVGVMPTFARAVLAPVLDRFGRLYPQVDIKVLEAYSPVLASDVTGGALDVAIVPSNREMSGIRGSHLDADIEVFVSGKESEWEHLKAVELSKCRPLKLALPGPENARRMKIDNYLATYNVPVQQVMELDSMMATMDLVSKSDWSTILPGCLCVPDIDGRERKLHPIVNPALTVDYVLIEPESKMASQAVRLFIDELRQQIRETCAFCREKFG